MHDFYFVHRAEPSHGLYENLPNLAFFDISLLFLVITNILFYCKRPFLCLEAVDCRLGWLVAVVMADVVKT